MCGLSHFKGGQQPQPSGLKWLHGLQVLHCGELQKLQKAALGLRMFRTSSTIASSVQ